MPILPDKFSDILRQFANHFGPAVWTHAQVLLIGAILAHGQRTVASALRVMGLGDETHFENHHRVLNRAI